jgi:hypothetical protein
MSIFQPKIGSQVEEVEYIAYKCEGNQFRGGRVDITAFGALPDPLYG